MNDELKKILPFCTNETFALCVISLHYKLHYCIILMFMFCSVHLFFPHFLNFRMDTQTFIVGFIVAAAGDFVVAVQTELITS